MIRYTIEQMSDGWYVADAFCVWHTQRVAGPFATEGGARRAMLRLSA